MKDCTTTIKRYSLILLLISGGICWLVLSVHPTSASKQTFGTLLGVYRTLNYLGVSVDVEIRSNGSVDYYYCDHVPNSKCINTTYSSGVKWQCVELVTLPQNKTIEK
jgi:hypothetical protein